MNIQYINNNCVLFRIDFLFLLFKNFRYSVTMSGRFSTCISHLSCICHAEGIAQFDALHAVNKRIKLHPQFGNQTFLFETRTTDNPTYGKQCKQREDVNISLT
jgi:hypothetical protein